MQARFDKDGKQLPDTGHGCGCRLCAISNAPRYERRDDPQDRVYFSALDGGDPSATPVDDFEAWYDRGVPCRDLPPWVEPPDVTHGNIVINGG